MKQKIMIMSNLRKTIITKMNNSKMKIKKISLLKMRIIRKYKSKNH